MQEMAAPFKDRRPAIVPPIPEHVWPTNAEDEKATTGAVWCMRCGYLVWTARRGDVSDYDCRTIKVGLR